MNTHAVMVFNTCTSQYEEVSVTKEVYDEYRRGEWQIQNNDAKHRANETPFGALIGGDEGSFENFHEFLSNNNLEKVVLAEDLKRAIVQLNREEQRLIQAMFLDCMTVRQYGHCRHM